MTASSTASRFPGSAGQIGREEVRAPRRPAAHQHTRYPALHVQALVSSFAAG